MAKAADLVDDLRRAIRESALALTELGRRTGVTQPQLSGCVAGRRTLPLPAARMA